MDQTALASSRLRLALCCVNVAPLIRAALADAGHEVLSLQPEGGTMHHLPDLLHAHGFVPDAVVQQETLGPRVLLSGLDQLPCPKAYWALDPHLNAFWQAPYARLFDLVFSTQRRWLPDLRRCGARSVHWLPWYGQARPWLPWSRRSCLLSFVGRVDEKRPVRTRFVELLAARFGRAFTHAQGLDHAAMHALYARTRIVPNESILGEVNFRLFEATGHGCLVVGQALGPDQDELFDPDAHTRCYADGLELLDRLDHALRHEREAEATARAGWERLRAAHLPAHRAAEMVRMLAVTPRSAATGREADAWLAATAGQLWRADRLAADPQRIVALLGGSAQAPALVALRLRLLAETGHTDRLLDELRALLAVSAEEAGPELDAAAGLSALHAGLREQARAFWLRRDRAEHRGRGRIPESDAELLRLWAATLRRHGLNVNAGFVFHEQQHVPASASDCLALALLHQPGDPDLLRQAEALAAGLPGQDHTRLGLLSGLGLHCRGDWHIALETALASLRTFRLRAGREELHLAHELACAQGRERRFLRVLAARDPAGRLRRELGLAPPESA